MTRSLLHIPRYTHKLGIDADESDSELSPADYIVARLPELGEANAEGWAKTCCPFHDDHSPSFTVNLDTGYFLCFSSNCGVHGDFKRFKVLWNQKEQS